MDGHPKCPVVYASTQFAAYVEWPDIGKGKKIYKMPDTDQPNNCTDCPKH